MGSVSGDGVGGGKGGACARQVGSPGAGLNGPRRSMAFVPLTAHVGPGNAKQGEPQLQLHRASYRSTNSLMQTQATTHGAASPRCRLYVPSSSMPVGCPPHLVDDAVKGVLLPEHTAVNDTQEDGAIYKKVQQARRHRAAKYEHPSVHSLQQQAPGGSKHSCPSSCCAASCCSLDERR